MEYNIFEYPNGIRALLRQTKSPIVHTSLTIGAGSRDEDAQNIGIAHFIEHMLFKGTQKRNQYHINTLLDYVGGDLNAYTTKEETVIHASTLKSHFAKAVDLIFDITFNSIFATKEIEKEREVIFDEINSYKDSPSELIFDQFEDQVFASSQLGHPILGTKKSLKKFKTANFQNFIEQNYGTNAMIFAATGNISPARFKAVCDRYFLELPHREKSTLRKAPEAYTAEHIELDKRTHQRHILIGNRAYSHFEADRVPLALLTNILAGNTPSSILNQVLREKNGLTYNVESDYTSYSDSGLFTIYLGCEEEKQERCIELLHRELNRLKSCEITPTKLSRYKRQLIGQLAISAENSENYMLSSARSLLIYNEINSAKQLNDRIESITSQDILRVANHIFDEKQLSSLIYR